MSPDYLSAHAREMSPAEKGPQVFPAGAADTGMMARVTGGISQSWAVRSRAGMKTKSEQPTSLGEGLSQEPAPVPFCLSIPTPGSPFPVPRPHQTAPTLLSLLQEDRQLLPAERCCSRRF